MTNKMFLFFVGVKFIDPDSLFPTHHVSMLVKGTEEICESTGSTFDYFGVKLFEVSSWSTWSEVEVIDIDHSKLIVGNQLHCPLEFFVSF